MLQNRKQVFEINFDKMRQRGFLLLAAVVLFTSCNSLKESKQVRVHSQKEQISDGFSRWKLLGTSFMATTVPSRTALKF